MLLTEYDEAEAMELFRKDGHEAGLKEGLKQGYMKLIGQCCKKLKRGKTAEEIADDLETELSEIIPILEAAEKCAPDYDEERIFELLNYT